MRKKRKKRISLRPAPFLWILLIANCSVGLSYSRITSIVRARAEGVPAYDRNRIESILVKTQDIPCSLVKAKAIESEVMSLPDVDRAELSRNVFGSSLLNVEYRVPVAVLIGRDGVVLSSKGILYQASEVPAGLPKLGLPMSGPPTLLSLAGNWQPLSLVALSVYALKNYPKSIIRIDVSQRGVVCLNIDSGCVILGSCDDLDVKLKALEARLQKNPQELSEIQALNLTLPSSPTVVPRVVNKKQ